LAHPDLERVVPVEYASCVGYAVHGSAIGLDIQRVRHTVMPTDNQIPCAYDWQAERIG